MLFKLHLITCHFGVQVVGIYLTKQTVDRDLFLCKKFDKKPRLGTVAARLAIGITTEFIVRMSTTDRDESILGSNTSMFTDRIGIMGFEIIRILL